jgi:hypothetical protein
MYLFVLHAGSAECGIKNIHTRIEQEGYSVLGSRLILDQDLRKETRFLQ